MRSKPTLCALMEFVMIFQRLFIAVLATPCAVLAAGAPSFCSEIPKTRAQQITCSSPELWPLVKRSSDLEAKARAQVGDHSIDVMESGEIKWRDANCIDVACLKEWYETQIEFFPKFVSDKKAAMATSPQLKEHLAAYDQRFAELREQVALAALARSCFLRSQEWLQTIGESYNLTRIHFESRAHFTNYEHTQADSHDAAIDARVFAAHPLGAAGMCEGLRNGATMNRLDALQREATGGYH